MADIQRTRAQLLTMFADNVTGEISPQALRDFLVTIMEPEFFFPGDAFTKPSPGNTPTDGTGRGWKKYSQTTISACSFGTIVVMDSTGGWRRAWPGNSDATGIFGCCLDNTTPTQSDATILMQGIVNQSALSAVFSGHIGKPIFLADDGSIAISDTRSVGSVITNSGAVLLGWIEGSNYNDKAIGKYRFEPNWGVTETIVH